MEAPRGGTPGGAARAEWQGGGGGGGGAVRLRDLTRAGSQSPEARAEARRERLRDVLEECESRKSAWELPTKPFRFWSGEGHNSTLRASSGADAKHLGKTGSWS